MTDLQNLFLAAYPLFPVRLVEKFDSLLSLEIAKFNPDIDTDIIKKYMQLNVPYKNIIQKWTDNESYILNPKNSRYVQTIYYGPELIRVYTAKLVNAFELGFSDDLISSIAKYYGKVYYDARLYNSPSVAIEKTTTSTGNRYDITYGFIMSYNTVTVEQVNENVNAVFYASLKKYDGAKTVLAMIENGIDLNYDIGLLSEFVVFLNAYSKYSGQLSAENNFQAEKNKQQIIDYKNDLSEKLKARKNELQDTKTQIIFAAKNELASAKRDMQNLSLTAQNLILTLQEKLGAQGIY